MAQEIEIEFKNMLTIEEFKEIKSFFNLTDDNFTKQTNYYFDTVDFCLKSKEAALRIRKKNNTYELTLKEPAAVGLYETNEVINEEQFLKMLNNETIPDGQIKKRLDKLLAYDNKIEYFGKLSTERAEFPYLDGLIALDKSTYLNKTDYELEYEVSNINDGKIAFNDLFKKLEIPIRKTNNKVLRFYNEKVNQLNNKNYLNRN